MKRAQRRQSPLPFFSLHKVCGDPHRLIVCLDVYCATHRYFTRLWCVYEVACYRHLVPEGDVVVLPLRLAFLTFLLQMTYFVTFTGFMIMCGHACPNVPSHSSVIAS